MIRGYDRRPQLAIKRALELAKRDKDKTTF